MLVLSRKRNQSVIIAGHIVVTVVDVDARGKVRLGIDAPREVTVDRQEVHERRMGGGRHEMGGDG